MDPKGWRGTYTHNSNTLAAHNSFSLARIPHVFRTRSHLRPAPESLTQGFTARAATATIHDATKTGVSVSRIFQAAEEFAFWAGGTATTTLSACALMSVHIGLDEIRAGEFSAMLIIAEERDLLEREKMPTWRRNGPT